MQYERNPKHKNWLRPFDPDATLCPSWSHDQAQAILDESVDHNSSGARFGTLDGMAFAARLTDGDIWHGYPVPWSEVPDAVREGMIAAQKVTRRQVKKLFSSEKLTAELDG
ncbi:hypothetical protein [Phenylobacterium sp.]|uniref:hypothetical protein n=1 Tax=Phenylobacterium sp. TaxID=1871053 RepID=UPI0039834018